MPTAPWAQRQRMLNSAGQRIPKGWLWRSTTVSALLNGRYDRGVVGCR
ncbi:hypothetical protein [Mycobacterium sp.]